MRTITGLRISAAAAGAVAALAVLPVGANAAFDASHDAQCENTATIAGVGASFQRQAHLAWGAQMLAPDPANAEDNGFGRATTANGGCANFQVGASNGKKVTFEPRGSGDGRTAVGAANGQRNTNFQFGAADEPPTTAQLAVANQGPTTATTDDAVLLTVPVAQSSVATVVKLPVGCTVPAAGRTITRAALEGAFAAKANFTQWGQVLPAITGTTSGADCKVAPVVRVVRFDSSGTTFGFKNYLRDVNATDFPTGLGNTAWPNDSGATATDKPASNGAGALLDKLNARTDGGIAYADLAAARGRGFDTNVLPSSDPNAGAVDTTDTTFWVSVEGRDGQYRSPALNNAKGTTNTGSNCREATYADATTGKLPAATESWYGVNSNGSTNAYAICQLTYELVWQDMIKANVGIAAGLPAYTQDQARSVKDYLGYIVNGAGGQAALAPNGYQGLPSLDGGSGATVPGTVLDVAQAAQRSITWNGAPVADVPVGGGTGGDTGGTNTTPTTTTPTTTTPVAAPPVLKPAPVPAAPTTPATPAAKVTVSKAVGAKGRRIVLTVSPSAAGKLAVSATTVSGKKTVTIGKGTLTVKKGGKLVLTLTPSSAGKRALKAGKTVKVTFKVTFTAKTGKKSTVTKTIKVKIKR